MTTIMLILMRIYEDSKIVNTDNTVSKRMCSTAIKLTAFSVYKIIFICTVLILSYIQSIQFMVSSNLNVSLSYILACCTSAHHPRRAALFFLVVFGVER